MKRYHPIKELYLCRLRQFYCEPEAVFWTYGFPLLMIVGLGIAFKSLSFCTLVTGCKLRPTWTPLS